MKRYRQPTNIDKWRHTSTNGDKHRQRATNIDNTRSNKVRRLGTEPCSPRQTLTKPDKNKTDIQAQRYSLPHFTLQQMATDIDKSGDQNSNSVAPGLRHSPIDTIRQTTTKADKHRQHSIQQSPQARHRTLLASTNVDKARQKQNRHPSTATLFASFHTSTNGDRHRQERRSKLKLGCAGLETFAYRHNPTNNDKSRQASTKSDSDRAKRATTLAFFASN